MNQYIITEEQLWTLVTSFNCDRHAIRKSVRSHPYKPQAERERVLDEVDKIISPVLEYITDYFNPQSEMGVNVILLKQKLKELRKGEP